MNKREVFGAVIAAFAASMLGGMGSLWAFSRDVVTKAESKEIARSVVTEYNTQVLSRLASLEAKVEMTNSLLQDKYGRRD